VVAALAVCVGRAVGRDQVDRAADQLVHHGRKAVGHALAVTVLVVDALTFDVAELAQGLAEALPHWRVVDDADARDLRRPLGARGNRPRDRATEKPNKLAPPHLLAQ
jgi:hypothetical protein